MAGPVDSKSGKRSRITEICDNMIGSSKNLWVLISGASAITSKELVGTELQNNIQKISKGLNFYLTPSSSSAKKLQTDDKVDAKVQTFILQLAKFMNLDEVQCYELFCDFLLYDYRGSETTLQNAVANERFMQNLMLQIWDYYRCERLYLLLCIKEILAHFDDVQHPYHDLFDEFLSLVDQNDSLRTSLLSQWEMLIKVVIPSSKHPSYLIDTHSKTLLWFTLREQCELLQALLIYFNGKPGDANLFLSLLKSFREHGFGWQQLHTYRFDMNPATQDILQSIGYLECLILLQTLNLHTLEETSDGIHEFFLFKNKVVWKEVNTIMGRLASQREPMGKLVSLLCLAWAVIRFYVLSDDVSSHGITRGLGESALQFGVFDFLHSLVLNRAFQGDGPIPRTTRSIISRLLSALLSKFDDSTLGNTQSLYMVVGELVKDPMVSERFWKQGLESSLGMLLATSMSYFPHCFCTLVDLLSGLAESSPMSAMKVFVCFNELPNFTAALLPDIEVEELRTDEQMLRLVQDFNTGTVRLNAGCLGYSVPSKIQGQYDVVQWQQNVNGWEISLMMMKSIVGCEQITPAQIRNVASLARLLRSVLVNQPDTYLKLDQLVDQLFLVIQRFSKLTNPPADVIASALHLASAVSGNDRLLHMWQRLVHVGFLPMSPSIASSCHNNVEFSHGTINSIISSCECVSGEYPVTLAFLNLISTFVPVLVDQDDPHFSACVAFIVREIFPSHSRFWYRSVEQKEEMAQKCLNVIHLILRVPSVNSTQKNSGLSKNSVQAVVLQCLLHQEAGHSLLQIICQLAAQPTRSDVSEGTGAEEDVGHQTLEQQIGWVSGQGLQPFKLALSVLNRVLILWDCEVQQQPSVLITSLCSNPHAIRTVANYIYQSDTRLATLAVLLMRRFAKVLSISLLVCLGPDAATFCKLLLFRLEARAEDIHLKAAILTFMSACVESQPGTTEVFIGNLNHSKSNSEGKLTSGSGSCESHCLKLVVDILRRSKEESSGRLEELRIGALSFLKSLWIGRQTIALNDLRKCSDIWKILLEPLLADDGLASHPQSSALTLGLLAQEFILKPSRGENNAQLLGLLQKISDSALLKWLDSVYEKLAAQGINSQADTSMIVDNLADSPEGLLKAWNNFLAIGMKTNLLTVPSDHKGTIVNTTINALNDELSRECHKTHIKVLSETLLHLLRLWNGSELNSNETMEATGRLLNTVMAAGASIPSKVMANIVASFIEIVPNSSENGLDSRTVNSWMGTMCDVIHQSVLLAERTVEQGDSSAATKTQLVVLCVSLLQKFSWVCSDTKLLLVHLQRSAVLHTLLRFTQTCLQRGVPEGCHDVLQLFCCLSNHPQVARSIIEAEVVQTLCLPLAEVQLHQAGTSIDQTQMKWRNVYRSALHLLTCLMHNLRHYVMEPTFLDFVRVHLTIFVKIPGQLQYNLCSESMEMTLSVLHLFEELSHFRSLQMHSITPRREILTITSSICYIAIAYLLRPRLILHSMGIRDPEGDKDKSTRKLSTVDFDQKNPKQTDAMTKLLQIASLCTTILCNFSPDLLELLSSKGYDTAHWEQLLAFGFTTPSLDQISEANFGTIISSVIVCLKLLGLGDHTLSPVPVSTAPENAFPDRKLVTTFLEKSLYLILSQAILLNANQPVWDKQLFKRELGAELGQFVHSRHIRRVPGASSPLCSPASSAPSVSPVQMRARMPYEKSPFLTLVSTLVENLFK